jgi:cytosine/adenosine deaminase-related metal-dependent hydrolase
MSVNFRLLLANFLAIGLGQVSLAQGPPVVFVNVTMIAMDGERTSPHQTIVTRAGAIVEAGPVNTVKVPTGSQVIDGRGRYLIPGLVDMHAHFLRPPNLGEKQDLDFERYLQYNELFALLHIANGVTSIRNMYGHPEIDRLSVRIQRGELPGPTVYSTGPITDGEPPSIVGARVVTNPEQAAAAVRDDKARGYVGIKPYSRLTLESYRAIVQSAATENLPVMGHLPFAVPLEEAIHSRQASIEHADSFSGDLQPNPADADKKTDTELYTEADMTKMAHFAIEMRDAGVWTCPTVVVYQMEWPKDRVSAGMQYVPDEIKNAYRKHYETFTFAPASIEIAYGLSIIRSLHAAGAGLLAGSDAFKPNAVPGFALHEELNYFVQAGLTPYEALRAATSDPARFLGREKEFGTIQVGRRADLILLSADPLDDINNLAKQIGVMVRGRWFTQANLARRLDRYIQESTRQKDAKSSPSPRAAKHQHRHSGAESAAALQQSGLRAKPESWN